MSKKKQRKEKEKRKQREKKRPQTHIFFAHGEEKKVFLNYFGNYKLQTFYKIILCSYKNAMKHLISSCKPDLRQRLPVIYWT